MQCFHILEVRGEVFGACRGDGAGREGQVLDGRYEAFGGGVWVGRRGVWVVGVLEGVGVDEHVGQAELVDVAEGPQQVRTQRDAPVVLARYGEFGQFAQGIEACDGELEPRRDFQYGHLSQVGQYGYDGEQELDVQLVVEADYVAGGCDVLLFLFLFLL